MKALVGAFNQEKALVGAFSVIVQPVVEPMDRFTALIRMISWVRLLRANKQAFELLCLIVSLPLVKHLITTLETNLREDFTITELVT